ncbi:Putative concanavalin A-like lectin/glucanase domain superfamily [Septoria linicola]|uniref:Concanavalin A-like lectin/glucanase domain superfamily n=1 Tax=Septoria linicola TaxID=215465 RepID=A0A9Q9AXY0_9PEZI|nr:Putative concanavalin A-like lectin/glucanase domain superfamily [Septoria linicola]
MVFSTCGVWPAFWTYGPSWPKNGEIDIIEGINDFHANRMTLHTGPGCLLSNKTHDSPTMSPNHYGEVLYTRCVSGENGTDNTGCSIGTRDTTSYVDGLNAIGGGIYATDWTDEYIAIYFFPRISCRGDDVSGPLGEHPDPAPWGLPLSKFYLTCDIGRNFRNHSIIFDITFCGGWADGKQCNTSTPINSTWPPEPTFDGGYGVVGNQSCARKTGHSCKDWVMNHPEAFKDAYWSVDALRVYQEQQVEHHSTYQPTPPIEPGTAGLHDLKFSESGVADTTSVKEEQLNKEQLYEHRSRLVRSRHLGLGLPPVGS